jgi:hypothetical protein
MFVAAGPPATVRPAPSGPANSLRKAGASKPVSADSFTVSVSPATISFTATNPNSAPVDSGSSTATVSWENLDFAQGAWSLTVQAPSSAFSSCPTVPVSAVTVSCASVSATIGGTGTCSPPFALSTAAQTVASGNQAILTFSYTVTLNFTLADNWKYIAETSPSCSLLLSYIATVP